MIEAARKGRAAFRRTLLPTLWTVAVCFLAVGGYAQGGHERAFPQSKAVVEKALKEMQSATGGRLPLLEGFATSADHPLEEYKRGYYQSKFQVSSVASGGSVVRVSVEVTAWHVDAVPGKSGYQVLSSNGRLETDLLDQLADQLSASAGVKSPARVTSGQAAKPAGTSEPTISAPMPRLPDVNGSYSSSLAQSMEGQGGAQTGTKQGDDSRLEAEADSLEEVVKNQAHPKNLVAVKKSGTPVVGTPSLTAKALFLASAHDEFEMLDFNRDWVHVRISGLSRGWIWRDNLELPDSVPDADAPTGPAPGPVAGELFHVSREEDSPFPGDWAPLRGKSVKIVSVEKINEGEKDAGPRLRLEFAKFVLDKDYAELARKPQQLAGIVVIFDSADGGMIAATFPTLEQWKAGKLTDAGLWHQCFFDPPETFAEPGPGAVQ